MEKHERLDQWIDQRMAGAGMPAEWPDCAGGRRRLDERRARPSRPILLWAAAALLAVAFALPSTRFVARQLWDQAVLRRIQVLLMDDDDGSAASAFSLEMDVRPRPSPVPTFDEATHLAGFEPRLLPVDVLTGVPSLSVTNDGAALFPLRTRAIRQALERAGGSPDEVPDSWNGAVIEIRIGPVVVA